MPIMLCGSVGVIDLLEEENEIFSSLWYVLIKDMLYAAGSFIHLPINIDWFPHPSR